MVREYSQNARSERLQIILLLKVTPAPQISSAIFVRHLVTAADGVNVCFLQHHRCHNAVPVAGAAQELLRGRL